MILKCKQKASYEYVVYNGKNLDVVIPFMQDSKNFISAYMKKDKTIVIVLGNEQNPKSQTKFIMVTGDHIVKYLTKDILCLSKKEFEEMFEIQEDK